MACIDSIFLNYIPLSSLKRISMCSLHLQTDILAGCLACQWLHHFSSITVSNFSFLWFLHLILFQSWSFLSLLASLLEELRSVHNPFPWIGHPPLVQMFNFLCGSLPIVHFQICPFLEALSDHRGFSLCVSSYTLCVLTVCSHCSLAVSIPRGRPSLRTWLHLTFYHCLAQCLTKC